MSKVHETTTNITNKFIENQYIKNLIINPFVIQLGVNDLLNYGINLDTQSEVLQITGIKLLLLKKSSFHIFK